MMLTKLSRRLCVGLGDVGFPFIVGEPSWIVLLVENAGNRIAGRVDKPVQIKRKAVQWYRFMGNSRTLPLILSMLPPIEKKQKP